MYPHESSFPLEYSDAQIAASQRINIINTLIIHTQLRSGGLCTGCEVWRFHLLGTWQWSLITNIFAFLFPFFSAVLPQSLGHIQEDGVFCASYLWISVPRCTCSVNKKNKSVKVKQFEIPPAECIDSHWGLHMQIRPSACVSWRRGNNSYIIYGN